MFASFGEYVKAKEYQEKALVVVEKNGNWKEEAACYGNLGRISFSLCEYAKAKEYQEKTLAIAEKVGDRKTKAECYLDLGNIFLSLREYFRANITKKHSQSQKKLATGKQRLHAMQT